MDVKEQTIGIQIYIIHGDDHLEIQRTVQHICADNGDPEMNGPNTIRLDGRNCTVDEIQNSALTLPFFTTHRLLILSHLPSRLAGDANRSRFTSILDNLPPTTTFILVIEDEWDSPRKDWHNLPKDNWVRKWMAQNSQKISFQFKKLPSLAEMPEWIRQQVNRSGGKIPLAAARRLAEHTGNDTLTTNQEIIKLLTYVNFERQIEVDDVERLTATECPANIFEMVDALGNQDKPKAARLLHQLLDEQDPLFIFGMIIRQFRLLILTREVLDEGGDKAQILTEGVTKSDYVANQLLKQACLFNIVNLEMIYRRLLEIDEEVKTSRMSYELALDCLIADPILTPRLN